MQSFWRKMEKTQKREIETKKKEMKQLKEECRKVKWPASDRYVPYPKCRIACWQPKDNFVITLVVREGELVRAVFAHVIDINDTSVMSIEQPFFDVDIYVYSRILKQTTSVL